MSLPHGGIASLPCELLLSIFETYSVSSFDEWRSLHLLTPNEAIISLSQRQFPCRPHTCIRIACVCRTWRELALAHATLWTRIAAGTSLSAVRLLLERSRTAPLHVVCFLPAYNPYNPITVHVHANVARALNDVSRVATLEVRVSSREDVTEAHRSPALRKLCARGVHAPTLHTLTYVGPRLGSSSFAPCELWASSHTLQCVSIHDTSAAWLSTLVEPPSVLPFSSTPGLRQLAYTCQSDGSVPCASALVASLRQIPHLRRLTLDVLDFLSASSSSSSVDDDDGALRVHLPRLHTLTLRGDPARCDAFISRLSMPPTVVVTVEPVQTTCFPTPFSLRV